MITVVSIQSAVAYGYAGNSAAVFPLQRLGVETWPIPTVNYSNHTGYPTWRGPQLPSTEVAEVLRGIGERGVFGEVDALLCGYLGSAGIGSVILEAASQIRAANPRALFCADPVMGDVETGFYAGPGIPEFWRDAVVPKADVMTPNQFELEFLIGRQVRTLSDVVAAAQELRAAGPETVVVTSVKVPEVAEEATAMVAVFEGGAWMVETPRLDRTFTGSGDLTTATFLAHLLRGAALPAALAATAACVYSVLEATTVAGRNELQLIAAQADLVSPRFEFPAIELTT